ncbi:hypothetical protein CDL15_Pgr005984 [Punica granatum]|uniref:Uncharacterized protein n=1 Tax=Punica granatum TaxID=22663 RepID=A0A218VXJ8_PUNGR|nr:hypothetical protein CDL15_Pgr005984 [Punica granatum]
MAISVPRRRTKQIEIRMLEHLSIPEDLTQREKFTQVSQSIGITLSNEKTSKL